MMVKKDDESGVVFFCRPWGSLDKKNIFFQRKPRRICCMKNPKTPAKTVNGWECDLVQAHQRAPPQTASVPLFFWSREEHGTLWSKSQIQHDNEEDNEGGGVFFFPFFGFGLKKPLEAMGFGGVGVSGGDG